MRGASSNVKKSISGFFARKKPTDGTTASRPQSRVRAIAGDDFSAKDFRTLAGTVLAARALRDRPTCSSKAEMKRVVRAALEEVSSCLGNTVAVCRKSYVHPAILNAYERSLLGAGADDLVEEDEIVFRLVRKVSLASGLSPHRRARSSAAAPG